MNKSYKPSTEVQASQQLPNKPSFAFAGGRHRVNLDAGQHCPHCQRELQAYDVKIDSFGGGFDITLACGGCHRNLTTIEIQAVEIPD